MSNWSEENVLLLKKYWGSSTAREIAEKMGSGFTRNSIIGKASRLGLSAKIKTRSASTNKNNVQSNEQENKFKKRSSRNKFRSLIIENDFEPENPKQLEEDLSAVGFGNFQYKIRPSGPGDSHPNWIFFRARKQVVA